MYLVIGIIIGIMLTVGIGAILIKSHRVGRLRIDRSIPEDNPYLFLELKQNIDGLKGKKYVVLDVVEKNYISEDTSQK